MVRAAALEPDAIGEAIAAGDFYASTGVFLSRIEVADDHYAVVIDLPRTEQELASLPGPGRVV